MYDQLSDMMKKRLGLECSPVAIAFSTTPPQGLEEMKGAMRLCQMLDKVRLEGKSFYTTSRNHQCDGGATSCGLRERNERSKTGEFLYKELGLFGSKRAARRFINSNPRIESGTVNVISFSPLEKAGFEPDVVALVCSAKQGMKIAEAYAFESGERATGMTGPPICSAIVAAPFLTGQVVYSLGDHGVRMYMKIEDEDIFVGIPAELLSEIVENLGKLKPS
jgi:uncharacterized protein (DUF169 family)